MRGILTLNRSISQNTLKSGGIKTALTVSIDTVNQVTYNTRENSNWWYIITNGHLLFVAGALIL